MGMKETYEKIYKTLDYGPIATARGLTAAQHVEILWKPCRVLCVGAGNAYEAVYLSDKGYDITVFDYIVSPAKKSIFKRMVGDGKSLPFKDNEFDLVMCCECLEHIPAVDINLFLAELYRVATFFYFTIDDADDPPYHTHVLCKTPEWWIDNFQKFGFTGKMFKPAKYYSMVGGQINASGYVVNHGFNIYGNKILPKQV